MATQPPAVPADPLDQFEIVVSGKRPAPATNQTRLEQLSQESQDFGTQARQLGNDYLATVDAGIKTMNTEAQRQATMAEANAVAVNQNTQKIQERAQRSLGQVEEGIKVRDAIIDQKSKVEKSFPLVRAVKSIFDPTWNLGSLRKGQREAEGVIQRGVQDSQAIASVAGNAIAAQQTGYEANTKASKARSEAAATNVNSAVTQLQAVKANWEITQQQIETSVKNEKAMADAEALALAKLPEANVYSLFEEAQDSGSVVVDGTRIGLAALQDRVIQLDARNRTIQSQQLSLQSQKLGIQTQQMQQRSAMEAQLLQTMNKAELESAIANGGNFNGMQFSLPALGKQLEATNAAMDYAAASKFQQASVVGASQSVAGAANYISGVANKATEIFGSKTLPQAINNSVLQSSTKIRTLLDRINWAKNNPNDPRAESTLAIAEAEARAEVEKVTKATESVIKSMGGTAEQQAVTRGLLLGDGVEAGTAAQAFHQWVNAGTLPDYLTRNPKTKQAFTAAQNGIAQLRVREDYVKATASQKKSMEAEATVKALRGNFVIPVSEETLDGLPAALDYAGINLGFTTYDWTAMRGAAKQTAVKTAADSLGVTTVELDRALRTGDYSRIADPMRKANQTPEGIADLVRAGSITGLNAQLEMHGAGTSRKLDEALRNPKVQEGLGRIASSVAGTDPGGDLMNIATGGSISNMGQGIQSTISKANSAVETARRAAAYEKTKAFGSNPLKRVEAEIMFMGLPPEQEQALTWYIKQKYGNDPLAANAGERDGVLAGILYPSTDFIREAKTERIRKEIASTKFEDPVLQKAAKTWTSAIPPEPSKIDRLIEWFTKD